MTGTSGSQLRRDLGLGGAVMMGLGSIVGTGVFVSIGVAAGITGPSVTLAIFLAGVLAIFNGFNSAQLAASHPRSGGTYEYGYRYLTPWLGFTAGWSFLLAKSASAATAALGFAGYLAVLGGWDPERALVPVGLLAVAGLTVVVVTGIRRSNTVNTVIVSITLAALAAFVLAGVGEVSTRHFGPLFGGERSGAAGFLEATALMFVAFTGYGRIATLSEEVRRPRRTIPAAVVATLVVTVVLYAAVAAVGVGTVGADVLAAATSSTAAPLQVAADEFAPQGVARLVAVGAVTAMLGVLLNLLLGLSRVVLAMGRRGDLPAVTARVDREGTTPYVAVVATGLVIGGLVLIGDVRTTWTFSAFTVLVYYAITNLAALQLQGADRRYPRWVAWGGLGGCLGLAFWVEPSIWIVGLALLGAGLGWHLVARRRRQAG